jgi:hypothetical protein
MYDFHVYIGAAWVEVEPDHSNASAVYGRQPDDIRYRRNIEGELVFIGTDYTALKTRLDAGDTHLPFKVSKGLTILVSGTIELVGEWDTASSKARLNFVQDDKYTKLLRNLDYEYPIPNFGTGIKIQFNSSLRERWQGTIVDPPVWIDFDYYTICGLATPHAWALSTAYVQAFKDGDTYYSPPDDYIDKFVEHSGRYYVCILAHTSSATDEPGVGVNYATYWFEINNPQIYRQEYADFEFTGATWVEELYEWQKANCSSATYDKITAGVKLFSVLHTILQAIDSTIEIYETTSGTDTGFMPFVEDNLPAWLPLYYYSFEDEPVIVLSELLEFYRVAYNLDWRLEGQIFVFRHPSEVPTAIGDDLTDWTILKFTYDPADKLNKETFEVGKSIKDDWTKATIDYDNGYNERKDYNVPWHVNLKRFYVDEKESAVLCIETVNNTVQSNVGIVSGETEMNGVLAPTTLVFKFHSQGRPFGSYDDWTGEAGQTLTLTARRQRKVLIEAPLQDFEDFDPETELIETDLANLEAVKIIIPLSGKMAQIESVW